MASIIGGLAYWALCHLAGGSGGAAHLAPSVFLRPALHCGAVRCVHLSPIGYGHYKYYMVFGEDTIPVDLNIQYYVCLKQK